MTSWLIETLVASGLLMGLVLALRAPVRRLFGARAAYALWLLPVLRMMLPPLPGWRAWFVPVAVFRPQDTTVGLVDADTALQLAGTPIDASATAVLDPLPDASWHLGTLALALWLAGAGIVFAIGMLRYRRFMIQALARAVPLATECGVEVLASPGVPGPVATGVFRRRILLPADFLNRFTPEERRLALLHEGAHHDRWDIAANFIALAAQALHWWNPLAWVAHRAFRADQELACDETVLADQRNSRTAYARALMKSAVARTPAMACSFNPTTQLKQRIRTMARAPFGRVRLVAGGLTAMAAIVGGSVATASGFAPVPPVPPVPTPVAPVAAPAQPVAAVPPVKPVPATRYAAPALTTREQNRIRRERRNAAVEARYAAIEAQHAGEEARRSAEQSRRDALRDAAQARQQAFRDADVHRRQALRDAAAARREADVARTQALQSAAEARHEAARAREEAIRAAQASIPSAAAIHGMVATSMAQSRARMAVACAANGHAVAANGDIRALALCGQDVHLALAKARRAIETSPSLSDEDRARALAGIDQAMARSH